MLAATLSRCAPRRPGELRSSWRCNDGRRPRVRHTDLHLRLVGRSDWTKDSSKGSRLHHRREAPARRPSEFSVCLRAADIGPTAIQSCRTCGGGRPIPVSIRVRGCRRALGDPHVRADKRPHERNLMRADTGRRSIGYGKRRRWRPAPADHAIGSIVSVLSVVRESLTG